MNKIRIGSIGLATAQGTAKQLAANPVPRPPNELPWPVRPGTESRICRPAPFLGANLTGGERWRALAIAALDECLADCLPPHGTPLIVGSCNGTADQFDQSGWQTAFDTHLLEDALPWATHFPTASSSCTSGLHALFLGIQLLRAGIDHVVVLAADILSVANHDNFEGLRVLATQWSPPWRPDSGGFILGEAAVALLLARTDEPQVGPELPGVSLSSDLAASGGLRRALAEWGCRRPELILGQGTGPFEIDRSELRSFQGIDLSVPLVTPLHHLGHCLGASGLLSVALAALELKQGRELSVLSMPRSHSEGRLIGRSSRLVRNALVACRALNGACAAAGIGEMDAPIPRSFSGWRESEPPPLAIDFLRRMAGEARRYRPKSPPDLVVLSLETPFGPPQRTVFGSRLLPSAVLEITPGFAAQLLASCWGFSGGVVCLVGQPGQSIQELTDACRSNGLVIKSVVIRGTRNCREIEW